MNSRSSKTIELACVSSGFGDGSYLAWSLSDHTTPIGIEVEFVKDGHVFGEPTTPGGRVLTVDEFLAEYKRPSDTGS